MGTAPTASPGRGGSHVNSGSTGPHLPGSCIREDINNLRSDDLERETVQVQMDLRLERIRKRHARAIASENCYVEVPGPRLAATGRCRLRGIRNRCRHPRRVHP